MNKITAEDHYTIVTIERKGEAATIVDFVDMCRCAAHALGYHEDCIKDAMPNEEEIERMAKDPVWLEDE